jgi:Predicted hydrolases or acyltransferases (alpha/beta hydrolase superfamily)
MLCGPTAGMAQANEPEGGSPVAQHATGETAMTHSTTSSMLEAPGARIYYEKRGSGSVLLVIPGGPQDAGVFSELAGLLADRYTVVTYDPRGNSRTSVDGELGDLDLDVQGDDAARLIETAGGGPAYVFGTSGGAQIGLNLAARHPHLVKALVAHEPPTIMLLDDPSEALAADQALYDTYKSEGSMRRWRSSSVWRVSIATNRRRRSRCRRRRPRPSRASPAISNTGWRTA